MEFDFTRRAVRQGDVLVAPIKALPKRLVSVQSVSGRHILAEGEATGHHHSIALSDRVVMFREDGSGGGLFLQVGGDAPVALTHQEHTELPIAPGPHAAIRQRTFVAGMARRVAD